MAGSAAVVGLADGEQPVPPPTTGEISLVAYDSCEAALRELKNAAMPHVGPYGFAGPGVDYEAGAEGDARVAVPDRNSTGGVSAAEAPGSSAGKQGGHSTTNVHESGVEEPDLVKTDGRRVVTLADGALDVVDVATRKRTARVELPMGTRDSVYGGGAANQLLLDGDRALVMITNGYVMSLPAEKLPGGTPPAKEVWGSQLVLVDLTGAGKVIGTLQLDGFLLDARQVGPVARVVVRSTPRLPFAYPDLPTSHDAATKRNKEIVQNSSIEDWLPKYELTSGGRTSGGQLTECTAVSHPQRYNGTGMLTVLSVDLRKELTTGDPVSIAADGDTVYGTGASLYIADDHVSHETGDVPPAERPQGDVRTEIYQFDISGEGRPVHVASGRVDGVLLNQYSLSEHEGHLRVATTTDTVESESMVSVLTRRGNELAQVGQVGGLGKGERIYSVRYMGDVAYLVTFRQTDPLYTVDLSDPAAPKVTGELKITGYSAYLHPVGEGRLLGVGQEATTEGRVTGLQVSLFDTTADGAKRLDQHQVPGGSSEVEHDPHAFLHWPDRDLVVVPITSSVVDSRTGAGNYDAGALVLRVTENTVDEVGIVRHNPRDNPGAPPRRALVVNDELWTIGHADVVVSDLDNLNQLARIAL
ncbi:hypothetical protein BU204_34595 [Actinophytocola xanthii]|uniref:Benzoate transporter n=1 Tax=Actinophytocola xanthii TaxID=1912961 RepID=A0A1Q8C1M7_9PSEU|nr:hypothetical protein BU204_34595 [Actinophytocola xanthii]